MPAFEEVPITEESSAVRLRTAAPWFVLVLGICLTCISGGYVWYSSDRVDRLRFEGAVSDAVADVQGRMRQYVTLLEGGAGLFAASHRVNRDEFHRYVRRLHIDEYYGALQGIGFAKRIAAHEVDGVTALLREERPDLRIWPPREEGDYFAIVFLEPEDVRNRAALGYDMASEPKRRLAMELAAETGEAAASGKVTLVQEITDEKQAGFLVYTPVYAGGNVPIEPHLRVERLLGFVYSPFRAHDFLTSVFPNTEAARLWIRVYDGSDSDPADLLYDSRGAAPSSTPGYESIVSLEVVGGHRWTMRVVALPGFGSGRFGTGLLLLTLLGSGGSTLAVFGVTMALGRANSASERAAQRLRRSELALKESGERLQLALAAGELFAYTWDAEHDRLSLTGSSARLLGATPTRAAEVMPLIHPADRFRVLRVLAKPTPGICHEMEYRIRRPSGEERWVRDRAVVQADQATATVRVVGICADITVHKNIEKQLRGLNETLEHRVAARTRESEQRAAQLRALAGELTQAEQRERRKLAQVLHDHLQQLLVAAMMRLGIVGRRGLPEQMQQHLVQVDDLLRQAIDASRSLTVELSPPVLYDVGLPQALEWLARAMHEKHGLRVEVDAREDADTPDDDLRAFLFQTVRELLFNIVKHAQVDEARVRLSRLAGRLAICVLDQGKGFEPHLSAGAGAASEHFGLFSIQQRLELLGGRLRVRSAPGGGTRVIMVVPATLRPVLRDVTEDAGLDAVGDATTRPHKTRPAGDTIRVVLADDHEVLRGGLAAMLEAQPDMKLVGAAGDGLEALELACRLRPDAVVLDVTMPRMDGIEAARRIREEAPGVRVIGLSMHEAEEVGRAMRDAGAAAYVAKSAPAEELLRAIRECRPRPDGDGSS